MTAAIRSNPTATKSTSRHARARCADCGARWDGRNALATASIHARSHGHLVHSSLTVETTYDGREAPPDPG